MIFSLTETEIETEIIDLQLTETEIETEIIFKTETELKTEINTDFETEIHIILYSENCCYIYICNTNRRIVHMYWNYTQCKWAWTRELDCKTNVVEKLLLNVMLMKRDTTMWN